MIRFLESLLRPPNSLIWLALVGLILLRTRRRRAGAVLVGVSVVSLYLLSTPLLVTPLLRSLDRHPPLDPSAGRPEAQAIVVLSAGTMKAAEFGDEVVTGIALERLRYAVWLQRRAGRPILLTGVSSDRMAEALEQWFGVEARWVEAESRNTHEHAVHCADLLRDAGVDRVYLVTHTWHMPRAVAAFGQIDGLEIVPAPMGVDGGERRRWYDPGWLMPSAVHLHASALALHEWIGRAWYRVRYGY